MKLRSMRRATLPFRVLLSTFSAALLLTATTGTAAAAGTPDRPRAGCLSPGYLCLWEGTRLRGALFTVAATDPAVGTCVDLADHRWGNGRAHSAHNVGAQAARLFTGIDCTGDSYLILPGAHYRFIRFASNSVYVH